MATKCGFGHRDCRVSTGIDEILTFGRGHLDDLGFWSIPCAQCARAHEQRDGVEAGSYWPHTKEWLEKQQRRPVVVQDGLRSGADAKQVEQARRNLEGGATRLKAGDGLQG